jgi:hypothetical protein
LLPICDIFFCFSCANFRLFAAFRTVMDRDVDLRHEWSVPVIGHQAVYSSRLDKTTTPRLRIPRLANIVLADSAAFSSPPPLSALALPVPLFGHTSRWPLLRFVSSRCCLDDCLCVENALARLPFDVSRPADSSHQMSRESDSSCPYKSGAAGSSLND